MKSHLHIDRNKLAELCHHYHISKLGFFGSVLRDDFRPESDVDVLVEFVPGREPGFIELSHIEDELAALLGHRPDVVSARYLNRRLRERVLADVEVQYAEG